MVGGREHGGRERGARRETERFAGWGAGREAEKLGLLRRGMIE